MEPVFVHQAELRSFVNPKTSSLPAYDLTGALWLQNQPLLINKEFNFGMAMSLEGVGTAIAVGMRNNKNKALAEKLETMPPLRLEERLIPLLARRSGIGAGDQVAVYGILYGQPEAQLRTVVEVYNEGSAEPHRYVHISEWLPVEGEGSWTANDGESLHAYFDQSLPATVALMDNRFAPAPDAEVIQYRLSGGEAVQKGAGYVVKESSGRLVIQSTEILDTWISYPAALIELSSPAPPPADAP